MVKPIVSIPLLAMYSAGIYVAIEAYASDRTNRSKYDAIIEEAKAAADRYLEAKATEK